MAEGQQAQRIGRELCFTRCTCPWRLVQHDPAHKMHACGCRSLYQSVLGHVQQPVATIVHYNSSSVHNSCCTAPAATFSHSRELTTATRIEGSNGHVHPDAVADVSACLQQQLHVVAGTHVLQVLQKAAKGLQYMLHACRKVAYVWSARKRTYQCTMQQ